MKCPCCGGDVEGATCDLCGEALPYAPPQAPMGSQHARVGRTGVGFGYLVVVAMIQILAGLGSLAWGAVNIRRGVALRRVSAEVREQPESQRTQDPEALEKAARNSE